MWRKSMFFFWKTFNKSLTSWPILWVRTEWQTYKSLVTSYEFKFAYSIEKHKCAI